MHTPVQDAPELLQLVDAMLRRRGAFSLKGRLLKGVRHELLAAHDCGLTWRMIWQALRDHEYPGCYQQFCKAAKRAIADSPTKHPNWGEDLRRRTESKAIAQPMEPVPPKRADLSTQLTRTEGEKPEWQIKREQTMARLDHEAEQYREMEAKLSRPKIFNPPPFVGRGE
jgi:hypothetical protein